MKIYIAGKITGNPNYIEDFAQMQQKLESYGHVVLNPCILPKGLTQAEYLVICFSMIAISEAVMFLDNWVCSKGAKEEHDYSVSNNKPIFYESGPCLELLPESKRKQLAKSIMKG